MKNRNLEHKDDWVTPDYVYDPLNLEFDFQFDPCPINNTFNGLVIPWSERNFINPPYSRLLKEAFVKKAIEESKKKKLCVMLLPVSTSTRLFHDYILPNADEIRFVKRRIKFIGHDTKGNLVNTKVGMHDSMIVIFDGRDKKVNYISTGF